MTPKDFIYHSVFEKAIKHGANERSSRENAAIACENFSRNLIDRTGKYKGAAGLIIKFTNRALKECKQKEIKI